VPFDEISFEDRCASTCLTDAFRSQGFSPSQRLNPLDALWLYFAPLPSIGFEPSELFPLSQPLRLSTPSSLLPFGSPGDRNERTQFGTGYALRLQSLAPAEHSSPRRRSIEPRRAAALLAFPLFEACRRRLRDRSPAPHVLRSRYRLCTVDRVELHLRVLQPGLETTRRVASAPLRFATSSVPRRSIRGCASTSRIRTMLPK